MTASSRASRFARLLAAAALSAIAAAAVGPSHAVGAAPRTCATAGVSTYTVGGGDSWFGIAAKASTTAGALAKANDATVTSALYPGDVLCLPADATVPAPTSSASCATQHTVVRGDSWFGIARAAGVSLTGLLEINRATSETVLRIGAAVCLPAGATVPAATAAASSAPAARRCVTKRVVAAGDSWYVIARATGVPIDALVAANGTSASSTIYPGQQLCLPEVGYGRDLPSVMLDSGPVRGLCRFANSWQAARGGGRLHAGVDLISPAGTPVVAVANGTLTRQSKNSPMSGNAWWLTTASGTYYFYAHMSGFAGGLSVGSRVTAGQVIGYVGSTGNAVSPHLHFEVHPGGGSAINPYAQIWMVGGCTYDRRYEQIPLS